MTKQEDSSQMTANKFSEWITTARKGSVVVYHKGFLLIDRDKDMSLKNDAERAELNLVADLALNAEKLKVVALTQNRVGNGLFEYRATKR